MKDMTAFGTSLSKITCILVGVFLNVKTEFPLATLKRNFEDYLEFCSTRPCFPRARALILNVLNDLFGSRYLERYMHSSESVHSRLINSC